MKNMMLKFIAMTSLTLLWFGPTWALHDLFRAMDADNDGQVSREEFSRDMEKEAFDRLDRNKDGMLAPEEWKYVDYLEERERQQEVFQHIDTDTDRTISFPEFRNYVEKYSNIEEAFMITDKNRDGSLSPDEVTLRPLFRLITVRY